MELHDRFEDQIWDALYEDAPVEGMSILSFVASLGDSKDVGSMDQLKNLLVWYMAERTAREIVEGRGAKPNPSRSRTVTVKGVRLSVPEYRAFTDYINAHSVGSFNRKDVEDFLKMLDTDDFRKDWMK